MINPKELRIGNQIYCTTNKLNVKVQYPHPAKVVVNVMRPDGSGCDFVDGDMEEFEPISLTAEWMAKCGFGWNPEEKVYFIQVGNNVYIEYDVDFNCSVVPETWRGQPLHVWGDNKYLHKLQNIYFDHTGEEITIKL